MYGCLVKMPRAVIKKYRGINQHPALAPFFGGKGMYSLAPHEMVVLFTRACGCTVFTWAIAQLVDPNYDQGGIIYAIPLQVDPNETAEQLQERLLPFEHKVQLAALLLIAGLLGEVPPTMKGLFPLRRGDKALLAKCRRQALENCPRGKRRVS
jgi:folate-dependent phosphoribosylglycinamide formyltransferase PurN